MKRFLVWGLVLPFVLYNLTFVIFPLFTVLYQSLFPIDAEYNISSTATLSNFKVAFSAATMEVMWRSARYALTTTAACMLLGYPLAYYIAVYGGRFRSQLLIMVVLRGRAPLGRDEALYAAQTATAIAALPSATPSPTVSLAAPPTAVSMARPAATPAAVIR